MRNTRIKKVVAALACGIAAVGMVAALAGCGGSTTKQATTEAATESSAQKTKLTVFAAASLTESLQKAADAYVAENPDVEVSFNFDSSGTLKTQIQEGAEADVFISAGQKQMNQLDKDADPAVNTESLDFVEPGTRFDILENEVTLVVPKDNPKNIQSFDDLAEHLKAGDILMAMGNSDVPVGQYTQKILKYFDLDEEALASAGTITYGTNVKEVTTQVSEGAVDCGVIYRTDAVSAGLDVVDAATPEMCGQVVYPAAVVKGSKNVDAAKDFLEFLKGSEATAAFQEVGFKPLAAE